MRCLLFASLFLIIAGCSRPYRSLTVTAGTPSEKLFTGQAARPVFTRTLYRCTVDGRFLFKKFHLSGLLYFRSLPDSSVRAIFQNEMGMTYFDFGWDKKDSFRVNQILEAMDKPAIIKVLKSDFELLLGRNLSFPRGEVFSDKAQNIVFRVPLIRGFVYYYFDRSLQHLMQIEHAGKHKKVTVFYLDPPPETEAMADHIVIRHLRAHFTIDLTKLRKDDY